MSTNLAYNSHVLSPLLIFPQAIGLFCRSRQELAVATALHTYICVNFRFFNHSFLVDLLLAAVTAL
jgi:hypothetical protein